MVDYNKMGDEVKKNAQEDIKSYDNKAKNVKKK
jgi:hypothetical protein